MKKLFEIEQYYRTGKLVFVTCDFPRMQDYKEVVLNRSDFEKWLDISDRLEWCSDTSDYNGEHVQKTGKFTPYLYWEYCDRSRVDQDLHDFIVITKAESIFDDIKIAMDDIAKDFPHN